MAKTLIFDFDGVLIDSKNMYVELIHRAFSDVNIDISSERIAQHLIPSIKGTIDNVCPLDIPNRQSIIKSIELKAIELTSTIGLDYISLNENSKSVLAEFKARGFSIYLLTNSHSAFINKVLALYSLEPFFKAVLTLDSGYGSKFEALKHIASQEAIDYSELIYIGDTRKDVELAQEVGCKIIIIFDKYSWDFPNEQEIQDLEPDFMIDSLADLVSLLVQDKD